ncbi:hypothetical protein HDU96_007636 [Phlyctochytrium bullatum]|nr:hypothetical protein HDU96_007636 [Phlyctochytrium bullatum]
MGPLPSSANGQSEESAEDAGSAASSPRRLVTNSAAAIEALRSTGQPQQSLAKPSKKRLAYACVHRFATDSSDYDVWFLEDVTRVSGVFAKGTGNGFTVPRQSRGLRRKGIDVESNPRYLSGNGLDGSAGSEDENGWASMITSLVPGLSHVVGGGRRRTQTEPTPGSRPAPRSGNGTESPVVLSNQRFPTSIEGARDFILTVAERRMIALASFFGLSRIPIWIFARLRQALAAAPSRSSANGVVPVDSVPPTAREALSKSVESSGGHPNIALQLNAFGRIHQAYPIVQFLGMSTENLMNRFMMRFIYVEDIPLLAKGMSKAIREGRSVFYVRWDWRSKQEERDESPPASVVDDIEPSVPGENVADNELRSNLETQMPLPSPPYSPASAAGVEERDPLPKKYPLTDTSPPLFNPRRRFSASEATPHPISVFASSMHELPPPPQPQDSKIEEEPDVRLAWVQVTATIAPPTSSAYDCNSPFPEPLLIHAIVTALPTATGVFPTRNWVSDSTLGPIPDDHELGPAFPVAERKPSSSLSSSLLRLSKSSPHLPISASSSSESAPRGAVSQSVLSHSTTSPAQNLIPWPLSLYAVLRIFRDNIAAITGITAPAPISRTPSMVTIARSLPPTNGAATPYTNDTSATEPNSPSVRSYYGGGGSGAGWDL